MNGQLSCLSSGDADVFADQPLRFNFYRAHDSGGKLKEKSRISGIAVGQDISRFDVAMRRRPLEGVKSEFSINLFELELCCNSGVPWIFPIGVPVFLVLDGEGQVALVAEDDIRC